MYRLDVVGVNNEGCKPSPEIRLPPITLRLNEGPVERGRAWNSGVRLSQRWARIQLAFPTRQAWLGTASFFAHCSFTPSSFCHPHYCSSSMMPTLGGDVSWTLNVRKSPRSCISHLHCRWLDDPWAASRRSARHEPWQQAASPAVSRPRLSMFATCHTADGELFY